MRLVPSILLAAACQSGDSTGSHLPYSTSFATVGDTVVASTTGNVPDSLVRQLVVDWRVQTDTGRNIIGDVQNMAVASDGQVWVWDNATPALWLIDANGKDMRRVSRPGSGPGEYRSANDIKVARDGALVMWDDDNARLNIYNRDGTHRASAPLSFSDCCGLPITIDTLNRIWLTTLPRMIEAKDNAVNPKAFIANEIGYRRFDSTGSPIDTVIPATLPGADGKVSALDVSSDGIGGAVRQVPYATYPRQAVSPLGFVVSAMSRPYAVHAQVNGKVLRITRDFVPPPVDEQERAQWRANIEFFMRRANSNFTWNGPEIPHDKPPISDIAVGLDGRIWVQLGVASEAFEPDQPIVAAPDRAPPVKFRPRENRWDVFEPDGRYVARIAAPRSVTVYVRRGHEVWGVIRDDNDVASIVRMHINP